LDDVLRNLLMAQVRLQAVGTATVNNGVLLAVKISGVTLYSPAFRHRCLGGSCWRRRL